MLERIAEKLKAVEKEDIWETKEKDWVWKEREGSYKYLAWLGKK